MASIVDIHPHVISKDTASIRSIRSAASSPTGRVSGRSRIRTCLSPWTRPASTSRRSCIPRPPMATTTPMSPKRSPRIRSASPACISVDVLAPDAVDKIKYWMQRGMAGHAAVHHRQHHARPGDVVLRSAHLSILGICRRGRAAGLHADDAAGLSGAARADAAVSRRSRSSSTIWRGRRSSMARPTRRIATSGRSRRIRTCT